MSEVTAFYRGHWYHFFMTNLGRPPLYQHHAPEMARLYAEGMSRGQIARQFGTTVPTVTRQLLELGVQFENRAGDGRGPLSAEHKEKIRASRKGKGTGPRVKREKRVCGVCEKEYEYRPGQTGEKYCSRSCRNVGTGGTTRTLAEEAYARAPKMCPCGRPLSFEQRNSRQYCSDPCRRQYQAKKTADPSNYIVFNCQNCGEETTRPRTQGAHKYCSNECAKRHTKVRRHVVVREGDIVLDSGWEAMAWGVCKLVKLPCDRFDRENGVEWRPGAWYAPDFILPTIGVALEVKGQQDPEDHLKWAAYREQRGMLAVIDRTEMDTLRLAASSSIVLAAQIREIASRQAEA